MEAHEFREVTCTHCGHTITVPVYCGNRFCPICSVPRLSRVRRRLNWIVDHVDPPRGYGIKFLTLKSWFLLLTLRAGFKAFPFVQGQVEDPGSERGQAKTISK